MNLVQGRQDQVLTGPEALGAGIGLFMWLIIWAVPMVVLGIVALVSRPNAPPAPVPAPEVAAVLCPQCGKYRAFNVSFCPNCGTPSDSQNSIYVPAGTSSHVFELARSARYMKRIKELVFAGLVIACAVFAYRLFIPTNLGGTRVQNDRQPPESGLRAGYESDGVGQDLQINAVQLFQEYQQNEVLADARYKGKGLKVTGVVGGIKKGLLDEAVLELKTTNQFESVLVYLSSSENATAAALLKGTVVTVVGAGDGVIVGSPVLRKCHFVDDKASPEPVRDAKPIGSATRDSENTTAEMKKYLADVKSIPSSTRMRNLAAALTLVSSKTGHHVTYIGMGDDGLTVGDQNAPEDGLVDRYRSNDDGLAGQDYKYGIRSLFIINGRPHQIWGFKVTPNGFEEIKPERNQSPQQ